MDRSELWRVAEWLCVVAGLTLAVASFVIAATTPDLSPWPSLVTGFVLAVVGIVVLESASGQTAKPKRGNPKT